MLKLSRFLSVLVFLAFFSASSIFSQDTSFLEQGFRAPEGASRSWTYWWWLNSYVSEKGITDELEEFKRQGIGGVLIFPAGGPAGPMPVGPDFMSPRWVELFKHALNEAERLGIEVSINLCDGWDAGGPWISADAANKKLTFTEIQVEGSKNVDDSKNKEQEKGKKIVVPLPPTLNNYYKDVALVAIPENQDRPVRPALVAANNTLGMYCDEYNWPIEQAFDGDPNTVWRANPGFPLSRETPLWFQISYHEPIAARSIYLAGAEGAGPKTVYLQQSQDGSHYEEVTHFDMAPGQSIRVEFPEVKAKDFRIILHSAHQSDVQLAECWILREGDEPPIRPGIKWWLFKSGNRSFWDWPKEGTAVLNDEYQEERTEDRGQRTGRSASLPTSHSPLPASCYDPERLVDLTGKMDADGNLDWDVPEGRWSIIRFGYTIQGQRTRCGSTTAPGYEADMLSPLGIESHFEHVALPLLEIAGEKIGKTLKYLHIDSYELGADIRGQQPTYSHVFREEFKKRRGYDLLKYLPTQTGRIASDREITNRFFWDYRRTIGDLMCETFFERYAELGHEHGIQVHSETGYGTYPHPHIDGLQCAGQNDIPMGEFWYGTDIMSQFYPFVNSIRTNASAAHIYGKPLVQAESFTTWFHFSESPDALKLVGDKAFCDGLNRIVFHQSTYQDNTTDKPGFQYGAGTHIDRNLTWWEQGKGWFEYLARCQHLLQQGRFQADFVYYYGEGATTFVPDRPYLSPKLPSGFNADSINTDVLLNASVKNGRLVLPNADVAYRILVLPETREMSPKVLTKIQSLIAQGLIVYGDRPLRSCGLADYPKSDDQLRAVADSIWGRRSTDSGSRNLGRGKIVWGIGLDVLARQLALFPDCGIERPTTKEIVGLSEIEFLHRTSNDSEIYFLSNQTDREQAVDCNFRVFGKTPELWNPVSGEIRALPRFQRNAKTGQTTVSLRFAPKQSWFVVFRDSQPSGTTRPVVGSKPAAENFPTCSQVAVIDGPWTVRFDPNWGSPESVVFEKLIDWTNRPEEGIKHYSGKATYCKTFDLPAAARQNGERLFLDLGTVNYIAEIRLNGKNLGIVWTAPWSVEITDALKESGNALEIDIINNWQNRLIGDAALPPENRRTKTNVAFSPQTPLQPSGLLGPVTIQKFLE